MYIVARQFDTAASRGTQYYCDDKADLADIKNPEMGATAFVIHGGTVYMADSKGLWNPI
jgi:hypothetical protein